MSDPLPSASRPALPLYQGESLLFPLERGTAVPKARQGVAHKPR
jgi:hypothetical protein